MLHAKFQDHRTSGSGEEDFLRFLPYMGMTANFTRKMFSYKLEFSRYLYESEKTTCLSNF